MPAPLLTRDQSWFCARCHIEQTHAPTVYGVPLCPLCLTGAAEFPDRPYHFQAKCWALQRALDASQRDYMRLFRQHQAMRDDCKMMADLLRECAGLMASWSGAEEDWQRTRQMTDRIRAVLAPPPLLLRPPEEVTFESLQPQVAELDDLSEPALSPPAESGVKHAI